MTTTAAAVAPVASPPPPLPTADGDALDAKLRDAATRVKPAKATVPDAGRTVATAVAGLVSAMPERAQACPVWLPADDHSPFGVCNSEFTQYQLPSGRWAPDMCASCSKAAADDAAQAEAATRDAEQRERAVAAKLAALHVPRQYAGATFDTFALVGDATNRTVLALKLARAKRYVAAWPERATNPRFPALVVLQGPPGTGKTRIAYTIAQALVRQYLASVVVTTLADATRDVREAWRKSDRGPSDKARLKVYRDADLLVLDEVSAHAMYGEPSQMLYDLLAPREADNRPTILTTNESVAQFEQFIGPALVSRVAGVGVWTFGATDYRLPENRAGGDPAADREVSA